MTHLRLPVAALLLTVMLTAGCGLVLQGAPRLVSPPNGSTRPCFTDPAGGWIFTWTAVPNAITYVFQIYDNVSGVLEFQHVLAGAPPDTTATLPGDPTRCDRVFRWRVGATFTGNTAPAWSEFWIVTTLP
jgi:hypothetical protein